MRTKTLLLSAAALAAGVVASQAQSNVYSANVVGYASVVYAGNGQFTLVANPFDNGAGNLLTNVVDGANTLPAQSQVLTWDNIAGYSTSKKSAGGVWNTDPALAPGIGFFVRNGAPGGGALPITNTFVGSVIVPNGSSVTNQVPLNFSLQSSAIPYSGQVVTATLAGGNTNMDFGTGLGAQSQILTWDPVAGYSTAKKSAGGVWNVSVTVNPGQGFFVFNKSGPATNVVETLNLQ